MRVQSLLLLALLLIPARASALGSCGKGGVTGERQRVDFQGSVYYVTTPADYSANKQWPLIFGLHGDEGDPAKSVNSLWRRVVDGNFIFVAPKAPNEGGSWYEERESNFEWMDALLRSVLAVYNVDLDRVGIWGLSGGAVFISSYALERQDVFSAIEFNMGGGGRRYIQPKRPDCKAPVRFVVSPNDFLRENALGLYDLLKKNGHDATWIDAACDGHCFDQQQAGPVARDWLLSHTLCGATPNVGCKSGEGGAPSTGAGGATTGSGGGSSSGGTSNAGSNSGSGGSPSTGGSSDSTPNGAAGRASGGTPSRGGVSGSNPSTSDASPADESEEAGCSCSVPTRTRHNAWLSLLLIAPLGLRRRARRAIRSKSSSN